MNDPLSYHRIRTILAFDALTCLISGAVMAFAATPLATLTAMDMALFRNAGVALFPVALLFLWMARTPLLNRALIRLAVVGNIGWVAASMAVLAVAQPNTIGSLFVIAQATFVAVMAGLEARDAFGSRAVTA